MKLKMCTRQGGCCRLNNFPRLRHICARVNNVDHGVEIYESS